VAENGKELEPPTGKKKGDEALLVALASGQSVPRAAQKAGVSQRTAYRRLRDPAFKARVTKARADMVERALGHLAAGTTEAAVALRQLLRHADAKVRLGAAKAILDSEMKLRAEVDLARRIEALEETLQQGHSQ
jgi:hypothetical protein